MNNAEPKEQKRDLEKTLANSLYTLWEAHSLYDSRKDGKLRVLLVGSGECLDLLRNKVLANGQLLDTELEVVIVSKTAKEDGAELMKTAPDLWRFIEITGVSETREPEWKLGSLHYQEGDPEEALAQAGSDFGYILVSTGDSGINERLARSIAPAQGCIIAYVQEVTKAEKLICLTEEREKNHSAGGFGNGAGLIEPVAYNLHHAYERGNNPLASDEDISKTYWKSYNRESNLECALHVRSKLQCCGISTDDPKMAVIEFQKMLNNDQDGRKVEALARLEHQRWCISKMLKGFCRPKDLEEIYSSPEVATHSEAEHWHIALVPYGAPDEVRNVLREDDWIAADPDGITDLDELDKQTLRVHKKCGELAQSVFECCETGLEQLCKLAGSVRVRGSFAETRKVLAELKKGNLRAYRRFVRNIKDLYESVKMKKKKSPDESGELAKMLCLLEEILCKTGAWYEYITRKDYKEQNRVLVRNIPFALSTWRDMTLVKLMSDDVDDCVNSVWQLAPATVLFLDYAATMEEMIRIRRQANRIDHFLDLHGRNVKARYQVFVGDDVYGIRKNYPEFFESWDCETIDVRSVHSDEIRPWFVSLMRKANADYIDMTGGKPELIGVAQEFARNSQLGAFVIRDGKLRDYYGAKGIHGQLLNKEMTVAQMFDRAGAKKNKQDDDKLTTVMLDQCDEFWKIAYDFRACWNDFCGRFFSPACVKMEKAVGKKNWDGQTVEKRYFDEAAVEKKLEQPELSWEIMKRLKKKGLVTECTDAGAERYVIADKNILSALRNSGKVLEYYIYCTARGRFGEDRVAMSWQFWHDWEDAESAQNEVDVICTRDTGSLFISAKFVSMDTIKSNGFVNHVCYEVCEVADHFGLNAKKILAAPNVPQYDSDHPAELSKYVKHAMSRGVYLLGDACFEEDRLGQVLENIAAGVEKWYEVKAPAKA